MIYAVIPLDYISCSEKLVTVSQSTVSKIESPVDEHVTSYDARPPDWL